MPKDTLTEEEAEALREKLAKHDEEQARIRTEAMKEKYSDIHKFLKSKALTDIREKAEELTAAVASSAEDRNLYYALDNVRIGLEGLKGAFDQRTNAVGVKFDD
jgi:molecular chaperone GrpE (heat shock protein)